MTSRSGGGPQTLPMIRSSYDSGQPQAQAWLSPRNDGRATSRLDYLEDRLQVQERTTQNLVDRAYRIKENIIDNLNITHGTWLEEKHSRELLQDHIRTITDVVRKLNRDIQYIEEHVKLKDSTTDGTSTAVKNLEMHHVAGLTDLRGRVARCDASVTRLSADVQGSYDSLKSLGQQQQDQHSRVMDRMQMLEVKLNDLASRLERSSAEQHLQIRHVEGDTSQQLQGLDSRTRTMIEETRTSISSVKALEDVEREKLEARISTHLDKVNNARDGKLLKLEKKLDETIAGLVHRTERLEAGLQKETERSKSAQEAAENKLLGQLNSHIGKQREEIARLKRECREGFSTVHDSITNMKHVTDGKRRLLEEQLKKEIGQIRRMVVLI